MSNLPGFRNLSLSDARERLARSRDLLFRSPGGGSSPEAQGGVPAGEEQVGVFGELSSASRVSGGVVGGLPVFVMSPELLEFACCGAVSRGITFCTLSSAVCTTKSHAKKVEVIPNHLYISTGRDSAYAHHHAPVDGLSADQLAVVLRERHTKEEWVGLLHGLNSQPLVTNRELFSEEPEVKGSDGGNRVLSAITPARKRKTRYGSIAKDEPDEASSFSASSSLTLIGSTEGLEDESPSDKVARMAGQWDDVVGKVQRTARDLKTLKSNVGDDIDLIDDRMLLVEAFIGQPGKGSVFDDCGSVWDGLHMLRSECEDLAKAKSVDVPSPGLVKEIHRVIEAKGAEINATIGRNLSVWKEKLDEVSELVGILNEEQAVFSSRMNTPYMTSSVGGSAESAQLKTQVQELTRRLASMEAATMTALSDRGTPAGRGDLASVMLQMKLLEARLPAHASRPLGGQNFRSRNDVQLFVEKYIPLSSFALFHDAVTILESLGGNHIEKKDVLTEVYQSNRVNMTIGEARHIASFELTLPTPFGRITESGSQTKYALPAIKSFKDWDSYDNVSGRKQYILNGCEDLKIQIRSEIGLALDDCLEARSLAHDMHEQSQVFIAEMCNFMSTYFHELITTSEATEEESWELVSSLMKKMFEEMRRPRAQATCAITETNPVMKATAYLWAMYQAHKVQREFLETRFRNHPSIAPVIVLHVFKTRVTRVSMSATVKRLEGRLAALEKNPGGGQPKGKQGKDGGEKQAEKKG